MLYLKYLFSLVYLLILCSYFAVCLLFDSNFDVSYIYIYIYSEKSLQGDRKEYITQENDGKYIDR